MNSDTGELYCSQCGNPVAPADAACNRCGFRLATGRNYAPWLFLLVGLLVIGLGLVLVFYGQGGVNDTVRMAQWQGNKIVIVDEPVEFSWTNLGPLLGLVLLVSGGLCLVFAFHSRR